ncbi:AAL038Wp [Eremothecium gossypii ATCC 10895]|uniref:AAL038Wp n=1 Tax=Eremothecium gossypii (strain ATCC 10895 / CBS 109.51 / FGSC 9923 / NRRL Y-1056) TaxID=284811 RepID=Q75EW6_EREGS|nr:AAL038Wp [Eremothecium gossypii ATCC 10895]AAS50328.1 AAL038Wp [Eremothecium gossypii ATCC 10895]AEY94614.1 FAAL038Wp [Eremothecium gossypii FDAG1]
MGGKSGHLRLLGRLGGTAAGANVGRGGCGAARERDYTVDLGRRVVSRMRETVRRRPTEEFEALIGVHGERRTELGPGEHLLFFNPRDVAASADGYHEYVTPGAITGAVRTFRRRMWAQGTVEWLRPLSHGVEYECTERVRFVREVGGTHYVGLQRDIADGAGTALRELRTLAYATGAPDGPRREAVAVPATCTGCVLEHEVVAAYSRLTLNPHRIHLDRKYCASEGYADLVVQGPLSLQLALKTVEQQGFAGLHGVRYKNTNIMYAGTAIEVCIGVPSGGKLALWIRDAVEHDVNYLVAEVAL